VFSRQNSGTGSATDIRFSILLIKAFELSVLLPPVLANPEVFFASAQPILKGCHNASGGARRKTGKYSLQLELNKLFPNLSLLSKKLTFGLAYRCASD
jgi:hypothetical protein